MVRSRVLFALLVSLAGGLLWRALYLETKADPFLVAQGNARFTRVLQVTAHRGTITDRYGETLAMSTPVDSLWINPQEFLKAPDNIPRLAKALAE